MHEFTELLKDKSIADMTEIAAGTGINRTTIYNYVHNKTGIGTKYAIRLMKYFEVEPPCEEHEIREYLSSLYAKLEDPDLDQICFELGVCARNVRKWLGFYNFTGAVNPSYGLFLMFCKYIDKDGPINKYTYNGV